MIRRKTDQSPDISQTLSHTYHQHISTQTTASWKKRKWSWDEPNCSKKNKQTEKLLLENVLKILFNVSNFTLDLAFQGAKNSRNPWYHSSPTDATDATDAVHWTHPNTTVCCSLNKNNAEGGAAAGLLRVISVFIICFNHLHSFKPTN